MRPEYQPFGVSRPLHIGVAHRPEAQMGRRGWMEVCEGWPSLRTPVSESRRSLLLCSRLIPCASRGFGGDRHARGSGKWIPAFRHSVAACKLQHLRSGFGNHRMGAASPQQEAGPRHKPQGQGDSEQAPSTSTCGVSHRPRLRSCIQKLIRGRGRSLRPQRQRECGREHQDAASEQAPPGTDAARTSS